MIEELVQIQKKKLFRQYLIRFIIFFILLFITLWALWDLLIKHDSTAYEAVIFFGIMSMIVLLLMIPLKFKRLVNYKRMVDDYCHHQLDPSYSFKLIEEAWSSGYHLGDFRYNAQYLIVKQKKQLMFFPIEDIAIVNINFNTSSFNRRSILTIYLKDGKRKTISLNKTSYQLVEHFESYLLKSNAHIVLGYNRVIRELYKNQDWDKLIEYSNKQRNTSNAKGSIRRNGYKKLGGGLLLYVIWLFFTLFSVVVTLSSNLRGIDIIQSFIDFDTSTIRLVFWLQSIAIFATASTSIYLILSKKSLPLLRLFVVLHYLIMGTFLLIHYIMNHSIYTKYGFEYINSTFTAFSAGFTFMLFLVVFGYMKTSNRVEHYFDQET